MKVFLLLCLAGATSAQSDYPSPCACKQYPDITNGKITGSDYPASYGSSCENHEGAVSECASADAPSWCTANWCYVDDDCDLADLTASLWFDQPMKFSYQNCGHIDTFTAHECLKKSEDDCGTAEQCHFNGGVCQSAKCQCIGPKSAFKASFFGANYGGSCAYHDMGVCHANYCGNPKGSTGDWCCDSWCFVDHATCPFAVQHPVNLNHFMAYGAACPQPVKEKGTCVEDTSAPCDMSKNQACECRSLAAFANADGMLVDKSGWEYNVTYGATCDAHDKIFSECLSGKKPDYCRAKWCWVSESCDAYKDVAGSQNFDIPGLKFSYSNCGAVNAWTPYACSKHTDESSCMAGTDCAWSHEGNACQWDKCMCIGEEAAGGTDGATCAPHRYESGNCDVLYDTLKAAGQMFLDKPNWCCKEFCYVDFETCPGARISKEKTNLAVSIGGVACPKHYDRLAECTAKVKEGVPPPAPAEPKMTCGDVREAYRSNECCGDSDKPFAFDHDRRMEAVSGAPAPLLADLDKALKKAMSTGGQARKKAMSTMVELRRTIRVLDATPA